MITKEVIRVFKEHKGRYGSPRIALQLFNEGIETNKRVVAEIMRDNNLIAVGYRRKRKYRDQKTLDDYVRENLLNREFYAKSKGKILCSDITYIPHKTGMLYLSVYIDIYSRNLVCYKLSTNMKSALVTEELENYLRVNSTEDMIIHTDRGSQYTSKEFRNLLEEYSVVHSMSRPGNPYDNAVCESFFSNFKKEVVYPNRNKSKHFLISEMIDYLEDYYPNKRYHSTLGMTPLQFEELRI